MPISMVAMRVPDVAQAPADLTPAEQQEAFVALGNAVSVLDNHRRVLQKLLQADDLRRQARRILANLNDEQVQALRVELAASDMNLLEAPVVDLRSVAP